MPSSRHINEQREKVLPISFFLLLFLLFYTITPHILAERVRAAILLLGVPVGIGFSIWYDYFCTTGRRSLSLQALLYGLAAASVLLGAFIALARGGMLAPGWAIVIVLLTAPVLFLIHQFVQLRRTDSRGAWIFLGSVFAFFILVAAAYFVIPELLRHAGLVIR